ncbi:hypothetical protein Pan44_47720 [Caulifigura coniformis]|uniref:Uncharacterized protein n=1 Tax=Caulifigura coniformis TaxID=2527983 RepID=A0A517SKQ7_9PLAN|nr:AAA family ATPase [Caulifigura coniformis]QDT56715.1 hypothetical protein Pan44_47720 [Caulifigura coniformis]
MTTESPPSDDGFASFTLTELLAEPIEQDYLVDGILAAGAEAVLGGAKKCLKTTIGVDLAISLGTATPFLGQFAVSRPRRVGMMSGESGRLVITKAADRIARSKGINSLAECDVRWCFDLPNLTDAESLTRLRRFVERWNLEALIVDPAYLALPMSSSTAGCFFSVGGHLRQSLTKLRQDTGVTPLLSHHAKDTGRSCRRPILSDLMWAGFAEWARQWILLSRRKLYSPQRPTHHDLYLQVGSPIGHSSAWSLEIEDSVFESKWSVGVAADDGPQQRLEKGEVTTSVNPIVPAASALDSLILSHVPEGEEGLAASAIASNAGRNNSSTKKALDRLFDEGKVRRLDGKRGHVYVRASA